MIRARRTWLLVATALLSTAGKRQKATELATPFAPPTPNSEYHLRTTLDADPSALMGRFVPDGAEPDDGAALSTACSKFVTTRQVAAGGTYDVIMQAGSSAAASFGFPPLLGAQAGTRGEQVVRVRYHLTSKLQYEVEKPDEWMKCCASGPNLCSSRFVSEFVAGDGEVFYASGRASGVGGAGIVEGLPVGAEVKDGYVWQQATSLDGMYFAFKTAEMPKPESFPSGDCTEVSWDDVTPLSPDGKYFVGVSLRADSEQDARTGARANMRQLVAEQCHGVDIQCGGGSSRQETSEHGTSETWTNSDLTCELSVGGQVKSVEARATCYDHQDTPMGHAAWLVKALYFLPGGCPAM
ncbi:MAG: hypothetical protein H6735_22895 [Alphaproteobacteria bacterium]|nr:hypothetical protein [Alphaproteobacteria bacterium]